MDVSALQKARYQYSPKLPPILRDNKLGDIAAFSGKATESVSNQKEIKAMFPNTYGMPQVRFEKGSSDAAVKHQTVGVILSGGQAPGGHNVITGLYDALKKANKENVLIGFKNGPAGLLEDNYIIFEDSYIDQYRNTGGFDIIGSGRTKLEEESQFEVAAGVCKKLNINALVIIGGDDSNTNAAVLAEYFAREKTGIQVIGCPKTIDGDLKNDVIEISFGFDTATKTYSELIGNICRDANSAKKYWHFIKVMGRSASHIALECALETQPNICLIGEEVEAKQQSLTDVVNYIADTVACRAEDGNNFGVIIIPEGLIEFIPEVKKLIAELNDLLAHHEAEYATLTDWEGQFNFICNKLCKESAGVFKKLPVDIQMQLLMDRDPHGNVQVSRIETDKLLITLTERELKERKEAGKFVGKFSALNHFFGYEGRCAFPSNFDADYCYSLGFTAYLLISNGYTGYIASITNTSQGTDKWDAGGMPITAMMNLEQRHGKQKPVIRKALTELDGAPFKYFASKRDVWARETSFLIPGAIQYYGPSEVCDLVTKTLELEQAK